MRARGERPAEKGIALFEPLGGYGRRVRICRFRYLRVDWDGAIWRSLRLNPDIRNPTIGDSERDGTQPAAFRVWRLDRVAERGGTGRYRNRRKRA